MHVVDRGLGTPLVLLHGFGVDHRILLPLDPAIEAAGEWRRIYIDLPGHGSSAIGDVGGTMDVVAAVEHEILDRVDDAPFALIGNSFGGLIATHIAHRLRDRVLGLATIAAAFIADRALRDVPERVVLHADAHVLNDIGAAADEYAAMAVNQTHDNARAFVDHVYPGILAADDAALARMSERYVPAAEPEAVSPEPFSQPALFITGRQDHLVGYRDAWPRIEHYPRATFAVLDTAGHNVHLDQPAVTAALVTDWLTRVALHRDS